jgi:arylsulfatase A-like enzyme
MKTTITLLLTLCISTLTAYAAEKPNIIFIMADDLGNADLGYRGSDIKTPNIDKLANEGVRLESFYGQQVCSPSRAALMTGRYPMRTGLQTFVIFPSHTYGLPTEERTLPQALKEVGYSTLMVGKWHLGHADKKFWPQNRGFDHFYGNLVGEVDYFTRERGGIIDWQRNGKFLKEKGYYTNLIGDEAVKLLEAQDGKKPFFLYFASLAPHGPFQAPKNYNDALKASIPDSARRNYAGMIMALDDQVGRIVETLSKKGLRENTLILFASDNGGATNARSTQGAKTEKEKQKSGLEAGQKPPASNGALREGKGTLYDGGVRVAAFANWPAHLKSGVVGVPLHMVDVMPTLLGLAGATANSTQSLDGKDIWSVLTEGKPSPHEDVLINVEAFRGAIRKGNWKLVKIALLPGKTELFDLAKDPGETTNLAEQQPEVVRDLEARLITYAKEQKQSKWLMAQPSFIAAQSKTILDPDFDIDDGGLPQEKPILPKK